MRILIVEDDKALRLTLVKVLEKRAWTVTPAENALAAQRILTEEVFDMALLDLRMPEMSGQELLEWIKREGLGLGVVMMSAHGQVQEAVKALKSGALDYISKPFEPEELFHRLQAACQIRTYQRIESQKAPDPDKLWNFPSPPFKKIRGLVEKAAPTESLILITGESGTGKEILARTIHQKSTRSNGPFVAVNIGGIPENLLESELFGYEKGAFTGADRRKTGLFETAQGGTLFLDEIGEMPLALQVKLLRVLQERKIQRLGGTSPIPVEARILCATNRDLIAEVQAGRFREDLFYRLHVVPIHLSPLRDRKEDLPLLCTQLLEKISQQLNKQYSLTTEALEALGTYDFPGNIRELENLLERACIFSDSLDIHKENLDIPDLSIDPEPAQGTLASLEKSAILAALLRWENNQTKAALELGITRRTLFNKLKVFGLVRD